MIKTKIVTGQELQNALKTGISILEETVGTTLGAKARLVGVARTNGREIFERVLLDDGVKVARSIDMEDEAVQTVISIIRESAQKQVDEVGDGTTATIILACSLLKEALARVAEGIHPMTIRDELLKESQTIINALKSYARDAQGDDARLIATVSAKDAELGTLISSVFEKMGTDGIITVMPSRQLETTVEYEQGMQYMTGFASPYLVTDAEAMKAHIAHSLCLITDIPIVNFAELIPFLEKLIKTGERAITIVSPEFGGDALPSLIQNKIDGKLVPLLIKAPLYGEQQDEALQDMAFMSGGQFYSQKVGHTLKDFDPESLGRMTVTATRTTTIFSDFTQTEKEVKKYVDSLFNTLETAETDFKRERLKERIARLTTGVAVIRVGGITEVEMKERRERADDAVQATRQALLTGVVIGGEVAYLNARQKLGTHSILKSALKAPFMRLLENAGIDVTETGFLVHEPKKDIGIDVMDGRQKNMFNAGIIDPVAVPMNAVKNAVSVASRLLCTGALVVPQEKSKDSTK